MKKWICLLLCLTLTLGVIVGCKGGSTEHPTPGSTVAPTSTTTATTEPTSTAPPPFDLEALQAQIPEELIDTMKLDAVQFLYPDSYPSYDEARIESKKRGIKLTFYAIFDDIYVVLIKNSYVSKEYHVYEQVEDLLLAHHKGAYLCVYCDGQYYTLQEAYDAQLIDRSQLETVAENYNTAHPEWIPVPVPGEYSDTLSGELRAQIEDYYGGPKPRDDHDSVAGWHFYGTYNGYVILMCVGQLSWVEDKEIGDYVFEWSSGFTLIGFKNDMQYELDALYAVGHITDTDLEELLVVHDAFYLEYIESIRNHNPIYY